MQLRGLVLTTDSWLNSAFTKSAAEFGLETHLARTASVASGQLSRTKYEAVILDFDTIAQTSSVLAEIRKSPSNKTAVVFAVATDYLCMKAAAQDGANYLLCRPIDRAQIKRNLAAAHETMLSEKRGYFRYSTRLPVSLIRNGSDNIQCTSINISRGGVGIETPVALTVGEWVRISFKLPEEAYIESDSQVIWDDGHGKSGIHFEDMNSEMQVKLYSWLDNQFATAWLSSTRHD